jgi:hypothetical protein
VPELKIPFYLPKWALEGIAAGELERAGSVVRESGTKKIVCWLRDQPHEDAAWETESVHSYLAILYAESALEDLSDEDLVDFVRFVHTVPELYDMDFYGGRSAMDSIVAKYERMLQAGGKREAQAYARDKRVPILNTFNRAFLPQIRFRLTAGMLWFDVDALSAVLKERRFGSNGGGDVRVQRRSHPEREPAQIDVTFEISAPLLRDLSSGKLERVGGVLREADTKKVVDWLVGTRVEIAHGDPGKGLDAHGAFTAIVRGRQEVESLDDTELIEFARWLGTVPELADSKYGSPLGSAQTIVGSYDRHGRRDGLAAASEYAHEKRDSLLNLLGRSFLPNIQAALLRGEIRLP